MGDFYELLIVLKVNIKLQKHKEKLYFPFLAHRIIEQVQMHLTSATACGKFMHLSIDTISRRHGTAGQVSKFQNNKRQAGYGRIQALQERCVYTYARIVFSTQMKNSNQLQQQRQVPKERSMGHHAYSVACVSVNAQKASGTAGKILYGTFLVLGGCLTLQLPVCYTHMHLCIHTDIQKYTHAFSQR